jgi:hypothetical protein
MLTFKKMMGMAVAIGVAGGIIVGASQVSYADVEHAVQSQGWLKEWGFFKGKKAAEQNGKLEEKFEEKIAAYLGMDKAETERILKQEMVPPRQAVVAAVIAKKKGVPLQQVITVIKSKKSWKEVLDAYGLQPKEVRQELHRLFPGLDGKLHFLKNHPAVMLEVLAEYLGRKPEEIRNALYHSRVHPQGAVVAAVLSKASGKSYEEVLALKAEKKTWEETAKALQVSEEKVKQERKKLKELFRRNVKEWRSQFKGEDSKPARE